MTAQSASDLSEERAKIAATMRGSLDAMVSTAVEAIWAQVPAYQDSADDQLRDDVAGHVAAVFGVFLAGLADDRPARREDFAATRQQAYRRLAQGISLADFLQAFRIGQLTIWQGVLDAARDDPAARDAALLLVARLMQVIELGSTVAGEAYVEAQQHLLAEQDRVRRDVIEDLLVRRTTFAGPKRLALQAAGLGLDARLLVVSATPTGEPPVGEPAVGLAAAAADDLVLSAAAAAIAGSGRGSGTGLAAQRQDEIVGVIPVPSDGAEAVVSRLRATWEQLGAQRLRLAIGVSTVHAGLHQVPDAYAEAQIAREGLGTAHGVLALPLLTAFDYLVLRESQTARRLIRPEVQRFVAEDAAAGGALIATLVEYAACDLNAKTAAQRLHLHVNTAYYRLERVAERTGCDLRRFADVVELLIAIRLLGGIPPDAASRKTT
jgi:hypothetical protein